MITRLFWKSTFVIYVFNKPRSPTTRICNNPKYKTAFIIIIIIIIIVIIIYNIYEFFISALTGGLPLEAEWQQIILFSIFGQS